MGYPEKPSWYVVHTRSGYEAIVKAGLEKLIENSNLGDTIFEIQIPMEQTIEEKNGKKKVVLRKRFPCYVFLKMIYKNDLWFVITNTRGVTGFVGPQGRPMALTEDEVQRMRLENKVEKVDFQVGDMVRIVSGALDSFIGEIEELNMSNQKAKVKVSVFGRDTVVDMDFVELIRLNGTENA